MSSTLELEATVDAKRLALEERVHEDEPDMFFRGEKEKLYETILANHQKEQDPVRHEAILLLIRLTKEVLAVLMVLKHRL